METLNERALPKGSGQPELEFSAGYYASRDQKGGSLIAQELLGRTMEALRLAQNTEPGSPAILPFTLS